MCVQHRGAGDVQYCEGFSTVRISRVPWGCSVSCGGYHEYRGGTQITKDLSPHGTEHSHGTHDIPHSTHDNPHGTEHTLYRVDIY